jgi:hypothetical protein
MSRLHVPSYYYILLLAQNIEGSNASKGGLKMKAALYARVSSEEQVEGYSIDAQKRAFWALVQGKGWVSSKEYVEEGKSARTEDINKRPVFKEMIQMP